MATQAPLAELKRLLNKGFTSFAKCGLIKWYKASLPKTHADDAQQVEEEEVNAKRGLAFMLDENEDDDGDETTGEEGGEETVMRSLDSDVSDEEDEGGMEQEQDSSADEEEEDEDSRANNTHPSLIQNDEDADDEHVRGHTTTKPKRKARKRAVAARNKNTLSTRPRASSIDALLAMEEVDEDEDDVEDGPEGADTVLMDENDEDGVEDSGTANAIQQFIESTLKDANSDP